MTTTRRTLLRESALGFGSLALTSLLLEDGYASDQRVLEDSLAHHAPTAKSVIFLFMSGGPGQTDTFDPKPTLDRICLLYTSDAADE